MCLNWEQIRFPTQVLLPGLLHPISQARQVFLPRVAGIVDDASQKITSTSPSINVLLPTYETVFLNVDDWMYPVLGKSVTIQWSPSNASTISIQVTSGMVPDASNSVYIASR
jgi:hypothetical protein